MSHDEPKETDQEDQADERADDRALQKVPASVALATITTLSNPIRATRKLQPDTQTSFTMSTRPDVFLDPARCVVSLEPDARPAEVPRDAVSSYCLPLRAVG